MLHYNIAVYLSSPPKSEGTYAWVNHQSVCSLEQPGHSLLTCNKSYQS